MLNAVTAIVVDIDKQSLRDLLVVPVPEGTAVSVVFYDKPGITRLGTLAYRPWPSADSSIYPGLAGDDDWEIILSHDVVKVLSKVLCN